MYKKLLPLTALILAFNVQAAEWKLDNSDSTLNFISTKKTHVSEIHQFKELTGSVKADGQVTVSIDLASVDTSIEVRNERMKLYLFDTANFTSANLTTKVDPTLFDTLPVGDTSALTLDSVLDLHGKAMPLTLDVIVTRLSSDKLSVVSLRPVLVKASEFDLVAGIDKLQELAGLPSIGHTVPVSFYLNFKYQ
jgi:polyisoprenoid-binding protein YceI